MYDPKACEHEAKEEKNVYCQRNSELRRLAGAMHCQIWVTRSVYMQFEAEDYRKIGFALYDYITLGYFHCSIDIINTKAEKMYKITLSTCLFISPGAKKSSSKISHIKKVQ